MIPKPLTTMYSNLIVLGYNTRQVSAARRRRTGLISSLRSGARKSAWIPKSASRYGAMLHYMGKERGEKFFLLAGAADQCGGVAAILCSLN